jgi:hypothetical protein
MLAVPVFVSVIGTVELVFCRMLPKLTLPGLAENVPCVPAPLRAIAAGEFGALLLIEMLPAGFPGAVGAKVAVKAAFWPAPITWPADNPLTL